MRSTTVATGRTFRNLLPQKLLIATAVILIAHQNVLGLDFTDPENYFNPATGLYDLDYIPPI